MFLWLAKFFRQDALFQSSPEALPATVKDVEHIVQQAVSNLATREYVRQTIQEATSELATKDYVKRTVEDGINELAQMTESAFQKTASKDDLKQGLEEQRYYFDAAVENIENSLRGVNRDEILGLKDVDKKLDQRVTVVEQQLGLPAA